MFVEQQRRGLVKWDRTYAEGNVKDATAGVNLHADLGVECGVPSDHCKAARNDGGDHTMDAATAGNAHPGTNKLAASFQ